MHLPLDNIEVRYVGAAVSAASNTDNNSSRIDMADYESVSFITTITDSVSTGVATLKVEENDDDSDSGMAAVTGAQAQGTSAVNDDINGKTLLVDYYKPAKRYVQAVRVSATANIAFGEVIALLVPRIRPVTQHSTNQARGSVAN